MDRRVILVGGFHELIELCEDSGYEIEGVIDSNGEAGYDRYPILGNDGDIDGLFRKFGHIPLVITPDSPLIRARLVEKYRAAGFSFATLISRYARISPSARIGEGVVIQGGAHVSSSTVIHEFVKLNVNANVMHDCIIGDFTTIAPDAVVLGRVRIGESVYVGANSTLLPGLEIASGVTIGAGAVVTKNITESSIVKGVPAK